MAAQKGINFKVIIKFLGILLIMLAAFMLVSLTWSLYYHEEAAVRALLISSAFTAATGLLFYITGLKHDHRNIRKKEGYLIVTLTWVCISLFGALPVWVAGAIPSYTDAFFETMSGFTTTGATILKDIEAVDKGLLFWRSTTHWLGGMGIIVLTLAILPILGVGGMQLFVAESPGTTPHRLHPRIKQTATRLWGIYVGLTATQTLLLMAGGMSFFHSINHAFSTIATGGFSTMNDSLAGFSPFSQYVVIFFMVISGISFALHYYLLKGQFSKVTRNEELWFYLKIIGVFTLVIAAGVFFTNQTGIEESFRASLFQTVSITTTTGFITTDYLAWDNSLWFLIFLLMFTGGCIGSTSGGLKMIRVLVLVKNTRMELKRLIHPMAVIPVRIDRRAIPQPIITNFLAFFLLYVLLFFIGAAVMTFFDLGFESAIGASIGTLGNIGPAIGMVGPASSYAEVPLAGKWVLSFYMLLGRLELFTVLLLFSPSFWKK